MLIQMEDKTEHDHIWRVSRVHKKPHLMRIEKENGEYDFIRRDKIAVIIEKH